MVAYKGDTMKCECKCSIKDSLVEVVLYWGIQTTPITGIQDIVDDELLLEYDYDDTERYDKNTELEAYECSKCGKAYTSTEVKEIFNWKDK